MSWNSPGRGSRWAILVVVAVTIGLALAYALRSNAGDGATTTVRVSKQLIPQGTPALPDDVERTRSALQEAAESGDYEALRPFVSDALRYTFGEPVQGGPVAYWKQVERTTGEKPLAKLAAILKLPYVVSHGYYVWPFAYTAESADDLTVHGQELLAALGPLSTLFPEGLGYLGWRAGIAPDGTWAFYVAGD